MRICNLSSNLSQFLFDLFSTDLSISRRRLDSWSSFFGHMPQIIGHLFQRPVSFSCAVRKIMAQVVEREVSDLLPLILVCLLLEATEPMVNTRFRQSLAPLRCKDIGTLWITPTMLKIRKEQSSGLIE